MLTESHNKYNTRVTDTGTEVWNADSTNYMPMTSQAREEK